MASLIEVVLVPDGDEFCIEAYAERSIGGWLRHPEEPPGSRWKIEIFPWPPPSRRGRIWREVAPDKQAAEARVRELISHLEAGSWRPGSGDPPPNT